MEDISMHKIVNVSWRSGVTVASSDSSEIGKNFVQLRILYDGDGSTKSMFTEMSFEQLHRFLFALEEAKSTLNVL